MGCEAKLRHEDGLALFRQGGEVRRIEPGSAEIRLPCIILSNPKYPHNVGQIVRLASCWGFGTILTTGKRVPLVTEDKSYRLPREERMRGYGDVQVIQYDDPFSLLPSDVTPVAVEFRKNSETLHTFSHPERAAYVFGPEDGSIGGEFLKRCHRFVVIPTRHCLNLSQAVGHVMYDRFLYTSRQERA